MTQFFGNLSAAEILLSIGILLMLSEILISGFVMLPMGLAFVITAAISLFVKEWVFLLGILAGVEVAVFFAFKRVRTNFLTRPKVYSNVEGMIGKECLVTETITPEGSGCVKLYGDRWSARCANGSSIEKGSRVTIVTVEGNRVFVEPIH